MATTRRQKLYRLYALAGVAIAAVISIIGIQVVQAANNTTDSTIVKVGVDSDSFNDIWDAVNKQLKANGDDIQVKLVKLAGDKINSSVEDKEIDLNAAPHYAYFNWETKKLGFKDLEAFAETFIQPLNLYSDSIKDVSQIKQGDKIAIPSDPTNGGRALKVLESAGLIKVDPKAGYLPVVDDVTDNPKDLQFVQTTPYDIPKLLPDVAAGVINAEVAIDAGLHPTKDAIYSVPINSEDIYNKPWINLIAGRKADRDNPAIRKVIKAYDSDRVRKVFAENHSEDAVLVYKNLLS